MTCINPKCAAQLPDTAKYCLCCGRKQTAVARRRRVHANGQGCVYKLSNGKWRAEKTLGYRLEPPPDGSPPGTMPKKKRVTVTRSDFKTRSEALAALPELTAKTKADRARSSSGTPTARKGDQITLKELYDQWEPTHQRSRQTMDCYRSGFRLFEPLWDLPMTDIDVDDLQDCLDESDKGKRTKENARAALGLVYKYGIPRNAVPKDRNLAQYLRINAGSGGSKEGFTAAELEKIRNAAAEGDQTAQLVYCHCYLGFRPTALLILQIADYDRAERALVGGIKTDAGKRRTVTVSPKIQGYVDAFVGGRSSGPVFAKASGAAMSLPDYRAALYELLEQLGIDNPVDEQGRHRLTPHSCRHTFATLMKRVDAPDKDKLELIGHTSTTQLRAYQDVSFADLRRITDRL